MKEISMKMLKIMLLLVIGVCFLSIVSKVSAMYIEGPTTLVKGETYTFTARDEENKVVSCGWKSSRTAVALAANRKVTAVGEGTTVITATSLTTGESATKTVNVIDNGGDSESATDTDDSASAGSSGDTMGIVAVIVEMIWNLIQNIILPLITSLLAR